jgi:hypothetical protein
MTSDVVRVSTREPTLRWLLSPSYKDCSVSPVFHPQRVNDQQQAPAGKVAFVMKRYSKENVDAACLKHIAMMGCSSAEFTQSHFRSDDAEVDETVVCEAIMELLGISVNPDPKNVPGISRRLEMLIRTDIETGELPFHTKLAHTCVIA